MSRRYEEIANLEQMSALISRQAAIDALDGEITVTGRANAEAVRGYARLVADRLKRLPSAEPQIIRCKDCTWWTKHDTTLQGKCKLHGLNPMPEWYCASGEVEE